VEKSFISGSESLVFVTRGDDKSVTAATNIGGLTGYGGASDSYSFCNVKLLTSVSSTSAGNSVSIGGLSGRVYGTGTAIKNSYAKGKVKLIDNYTVTNAKIYAGGITGYAGAPVRNSAALNSGIAISGKSENTKNWNRISPYCYSGVADNVACALQPGDDNTITQSGGRDGNRYDGDGRTVTIIDQALFENAVNNEESPGLGWDFETIWQWDSDLGLPVLKIITFKE